MFRIKKKLAYAATALALGVTTAGLLQSGLASAAPHAPEAFAPQATQSDRCPDSINQPHGTADLHLPLTLTSDPRRPQGSVYGFTDVSVVNDNGDVCAQTLKVGSYSTQETTTGVALAPCMDSSCSAVIHEEAVWNSGNRRDQSPPVVLSTGGRCFKAAGDIFTEPDGHGYRATTASGPICWNGGHLDWQPTR